MIKYCELRASANLKRLFRDLNDYIYTNTAMARKEKQGAEILRLLFAKLTDELNGAATPQAPCAFQRFPAESEKKFIARINHLAVIPGGATTPVKIQMPGAALLYLVQQLQNLSLLRTGESAISDAFQIFSDKLFASDKGQFFTPAAVVNMIIAMCAPAPDKRVLDPACGVGGFLAGCWQFWQTNYPQASRNLQNLVGMDKENDLAHIAQLYLNLLGRQASQNIFSHDSLQILSKPNSPVTNFDFVLTNPPFGSKLKISAPTTLKNYALAHEWKFTPEAGWLPTSKIKITAPQILFIELCVRLLRPGGMLGIVLPDGLLGNKSDGYIRHWLQTQGAIRAVVDCPTATFMPYTGTKTSVVLFEKGGTPQPIFFAIAEQCGHTFRGAPIVDAQERPVEDFSAIADNFVRRKSAEHLGFYVSQLEDNILVPRYYDPRVRAQLDITSKRKDVELITIGALRAQGLVSVNNIPASVKSEDYVVKGPIRFIRTSDILDLEFARTTQKTLTQASYVKYAAKQDLQLNDILFVKDGDNKIGKTVIIAEPEDQKIIVQSHFLKLRTNNFDPYLLLWALNSPEVKNQVRLLVFNQSTLSSIGDRIDNLVLPLPVDKNRRVALSELMRGVVLQRRKLCASWIKSYNF